MVVKVPLENTSRDNKDNIVLTRKGGERMRRTGKEENEEEVKRNEKQAKEVGEEVYQKKAGALNLRKNLGGKGRERISGQKEEEGTERMTG
jgi:hypothetical protein